MNEQEKPQDDTKQEIGTLKQRIAELEHSVEDRKNIEQSLHRELDFALKMIHTSRTFFVTLSPGGKTLLMNETMLHAMGYVQQDIIAKDFVRTFVRDSDHERALETLNTLVTDRQATCSEFFMKTKIATVLHVEWHFRFVLTPRGEVDYIFGTGIDITSQTDTQTTGSRDGNRYHSLFDKSPDSMTILDTDGVIVDCNSATEKLTGHSRQELIGQQFNALVLIDERDRQVVQERFRKLARGSLLEPRELEIIHKSGSKRWIEVTSSPILRGNKVTGIQITARDISQRREAQRQLAHAEAKFQTLFDNASDAIFISDFDEHFLDVNKTACEELGYTREELLDMHPRDIEVPESTQKITQWLTDIEDDKTDFIETTYISKDKKRIPIEVNSRIIEYNGKKALLSIARNITDRRRMQLNLMESEQKYRSLVDNALVGVYRSTLEGQILYANDALAKLFEYDSPHEMIRKGVLSLYKTAADREKFLSQLKQTGKIDYFEIELLTKYGMSKNVLISSTLEGNVLSGIIVDITARKHMEEQLKANIEKLEQLTENTIDSMANIVERRDPYTAGHQQRVARLALAIAREMRLNPHDIKGLNMAAVIHDIGKIYVPAEILTRPSKLSESEFAIVKTHPLVGYDILKKVAFPWPVADMILQHHERYNGHGYPNGLKTNDIMLEARILALTDVVEAMSSHRPYRPACSFEQTMEEITKNRGILYDPDIVDICINLFVNKNFTFEND
jgi:PAS domain S-box-containing protein/putative nucleotidyltransferase with HDIG domain